MRARSHNLNRRNNNKTNALLWANADPITTFRHVRRRQRKFIPKKLAAYKNHKFRHAGAPQPNRSFLLLLASRIRNKRVYSRRTQFALGEFKYSYMGV